MRLALNASVYSHGVAVKEEICYAMAQIDEIHQNLTGRDAVFTSLVDGKHSTNSDHYKGLACDVRIWHVPDPAEFAKLIQLALTPHYQVLYGDPQHRYHIHVSFRPKRN